MVRNYKRKTEDRWTKEDLLEALTNIKEAKIRINDAATQYRISRATLYRQYKKFLQAGGKFDVYQFRTCGGNPILCKVEEDVLEKTILDLREGGYTIGSTDIRRICFEYCDTNGIRNQFNQEKRLASDDWYYGFLKRHPKVRIAGDSSTLPEIAPKLKTKTKSDGMKLVEINTKPTSPTHSDANNDVVASCSSSAAASAPNPKIHEDKAKSAEEEVVIEVKTDEPKSPIREGCGGDNDVVASGSGSSAADIVAAALVDKGAKATPKKSAPKRKAIGSLKRANPKKKAKMEETIIVKDDEEILEQLKNNEELENDLKLDRGNEETDVRG